MKPPREEHLVGLQYLEAATSLLRRIRTVDPTAGLLEAADLQWWWRKPRSTDNLPQLFWFDDRGRPEAAIVATDWGNSVSLDPILMPDATLALLAHVIERGLAQSAKSGFGAIDFMVDRADEALRNVLANYGFVVEEDGTIDTWLAADARPEVSPLHKEYQALSRVDTMSRPHQMIHRSGPDVETRLRQTSMYRPDLDLLILDSRNNVAAYALFWFDPVTATGLVEPMRTEDDHQGRGLARHLLTTGIGLLAKAGVERIKICFDRDNPASKGLYVSVGFEPDKDSANLSRRAIAETL